MITSPAGHGVVSKDALKVASGTYQIDCASSGLNGKDEICIADGTFTITSGKDGIHSENEDNEEDGFIYIAGGTFTISAEGDGISAASILQVDDGTFIGTGAASMAQTFDDSEQGVITTTIDKADAQSTLELVDSDGNIIITYTPELSYEYIILSSPEILTGETYTLNVNGTQVAEITAD